MAVLAECEICGAQYRLRDDRQGTTFACRECGVDVVAPVGAFINAADFYEVDGRLYRREPAAVDNPLPWVAGAALVALLLMGLVGIFFHLHGLNQSPSAAARADAAGVAGLRRQTGTSSSGSDAARPKPERSAAAEAEDATPGDARAEKTGRNGARRLRTRSASSEVAIERFSPEAPPPGGELTIRGRGFSAVRRVTLVGTGWRAMHGAPVRSRNDSELVVRVSPALRPGTRLTVMLRTEHGNLVAVPESALVIDRPVERATEGQFFLVKQGGILTGNVGSSWIFVESGGTLRAAGDENTVFMQREAVNEASGVHNLHVLPATDMMRRTRDYRRNRYRPAIGCLTIPVDKLFEVSE